MLRIAICDKDLAFQKQILEYISKDTDIDDDYVTECFSSIIEVKKRLDNKDFSFDLLFLMIEQSGKDSIALIEYIREKKFDVDVFFMASNLDYITEAFRAKAFNYVVKPVDYKKFAYEMKQYLQEKKEYQKEYLSVAIRGKEQMIPLNAIHYFTSDVRKIGAFFLNDKKEIWFYGKLDDLEKQLEPYGYLRCHQSYLINGHKVEDISSEEVITAGGSFPISRKYANKVKEKWEELKRVIYNNANITAMTNMMVSNNPAGEKEATIGGNSTIIVTKKYGLDTSKYGTIIGIRGETQNTSYRIYEDDEIWIGRDSKQVHIVVNDRAISRKHCEIKFSFIEQCYFVRDCSTNGTIVSGGGALKKNEWTRVERNSLLQLANDNCSFMLV